MAQDASLPDRWRFFWLTLQPLDAAIYVGFWGAVGSLKAREWDWAEPAYQFAVAFVLFVLAADRARGEQIGRHQLVLWAGAALACGTAFAKSVDFIVAVAPSNGETFVLIAVPCIFFLFIVATSAVNAARRRALERDEDDAPLPVSVERVGRLERWLKRRLTLWGQRWTHRRSHRRARRAL